MPLNSAALSIAAAADPVANVIAVSSGKGGVGKTWFAITPEPRAGASRQERAAVRRRPRARQRRYPARAGAAARSRLGPRRPPHHAGRRLPLCRGPVRHHRRPVGLGRARQPAGAAPGRAARRAGGARAETTIPIIIDIGAGLDRTVRTMVGRAGTCLVVTTDEPTSLTDAYAFIKVRARRAAGRQPAGRRQHGGSGKRGRAHLRRPGAGLRELPEIHARRWPASSAATRRCATRSAARRRF